MSDPNNAANSDQAQSDVAATDSALDAAFKTLKGGVLSVLDTELSALYVNALSDTTAMAVLAAGFAAPAAVAAPQYVVIDATAKDGDGAALLTALSAIGLQQGGSFGSMASGLLPLDHIASLLTLADLSFASTSGFASSAGSVTNQADVSLHADTARSTYSVDGSGIKIGVLSDSFNNKGGMATDIASGDLPTDTTVLSDLASSGTDEGRAMAQIVHDIAPGASIEFATAFTGIANFANNIIALANAGAKVIVDDISYFAETAFQDSPIAQAIDQVTAQGVMYFSAAGNDGDNGFETAFVDSGVIGPFDESLAKLTNGATSQFLTVMVPRGVTVRFVLQWDQPAQSVSGGTGSQSDVDLFLYNAAGTKVLKQAISDSTGHDPVEIITFTNNGAAVNFKLAVGLSSGPAPTDFKLMALDDGAGTVLGTSSLNTNTGTIYGHAAAAGAIAVGAADYTDTPAFGTNPPVIESYSSEGPTRILFDTAGNRLTTPEVRQVPQITAPDGGDTTFFGSDTDGDGSPNFFGTSAAAPAAAAVAALMLDADVALTRDDILNLMIDSAIDMDNPSTSGFDTGTDVGTGAGLIQADKAVGYAATHTITGDDNANTLLGTHLADTLDGGGGNDILDGKGGADTLIGGAGDDTFIVNNTGVQIVEAVDGGTDTVQSSVSVTLAPNVEFLLLTGSEPINGTGNDLDNIIIGNSAANMIDGGAGADIMKGGAGDDTYHVDNAGDVVTELAGAANGNDTVYASVDYTLTAGSAVETLRGDAGRTGLHLTGNTLVNHIYGRAGADTFDGGGGADTLQGGLGDDTYIVNNTGVKILEAAGNGTDTVLASVSLTLSANVEKLTLTGAGAINGTGNDLGNVIVGNDAVNTLKGQGGDDTLVGGGGVDKLYGGTGADIFKFVGLLDSPASGADQIRDFSGVTEAGEGDRIDLTGLESAAGVSFTLQADGHFHGGAGELRWFVNAAGNTIVQADFGGDKVADFAVTLTGSHTLSSADFLL